MSAHSQPKTLIERLFYHAEINSAHDAIVTPTVTLSYAQPAQLVCLQEKYSRTRVSQMILS